MSFDLAPSVIYFLKLQDHFKQNSILVGKNRKQRCLDLNGGHAGKSFAVFFFLFLLVFLLHRQKNMNSEVSGSKERRPRF